MSTICPGLYRVNNKYMCKYINAQVNPALMPCLSDYTSCPYYIKAVKEGKIEEKRESKPETVTQVEKGPMTTVSVTTKSLTAVTTDLLGELTGIEREFMRLDSFWADYEKSVKEVVKRWLTLKEKTLIRLSSIDQVIQSLAEEEKELDLLKEMKLISEEYYNKEKNKIKKILEELETERAKLAEFLERIERLAGEHEKRILVMTAKAELSKLKISLSKLEQLFKRGEIDKETYEKLRAELEEEIKKLEKYA